MSTFCEYLENNVDEIIPNLWLGDYKSSYNYNFLVENNIKYIIRVMPEFDIYRKFHDITYIHIPIKDQDICYKNLIDLFEITNNFIKHILNKKKAVLIHCKRGHHRSASIVAAFLLKHLKLDYMTTLSYINSIRPCALRRDTCMTRALFKYYLYINNIYCNKIKYFKKYKFTSY